MIKALTLNNFKSHIHSYIRFSNLTVLTGVNGCGKTAVIQSLLLLRQSFMNNRLKAGLDLNKPLCSIGTGQDALSQWAQNGVISFEIENSGGEVLAFAFDAEHGLADSFLKRISCPFPDDRQLNSFPLFNNDFQYIGASRWGGRSMFPKDTYAVEQQHQLSLQEGQGELTAHFLNKYGVDDVHDYCDGQSEDKSLLAQTIFWERKVSPGVTLSSQPTDTNSATFIINYGFEPTDTGDKPVSGLRAENIGFGISYALPVIVALLSAPENGLVIIENPEAHLHPAGQAEIAKLIAKVAANNVQVIIETHSDHIITGIQLAVKAAKNDRSTGIAKDCVIVNYLKPSPRHHSEIEEVEIEDTGILKLQPAGFFDRAEIDLRNLYARNQG